MPDESFGTALMIWLIGHKGMLGSEVHKLLIEGAMPYLASDLEVDITDIGCLKAHVGDRPLSWIINCSAYTAVDRAEDERELAFRINSEGVRNIASDRGGEKGEAYPHLDGLCLRRQRGRSLSGN